MSLKTHRGRRRPYGSTNSHQEDGQRRNYGLSTDVWSQQPSAPTMSMEYGQCQVYSSEAEYVRQSLITVNMQQRSQKEEKKKADRSIFLAVAIAGVSVQNLRSGSHKSPNTTGNLSKKFIVQSKNTNQTIAKKMKTSRHIINSSSSSYGMVMMLMSVAILLSCLWQPVQVMAATASTPTTIKYRGPLPTIPSLSIQKEQRPKIESRLAQEQHPRWNTECLLRQEQIYGGSESSSVSASTTKTVLHKRGEGGKVMPWNMSMAVMDNITQPISSFQALAAVDSPDMRCNGRADLCDLRYNQVTYPATHNSAAYDLKYDCALATETCLQTKTVCTAQAQNCTKGWETRCTKMSNSCQDRLPKWMHWLCGAFSSVCESTEQFCLGWEQICTSSLEVCTLWGSACLDVIPNWAVPCLWDNQPGHPILQQLNDGIRFLDLGTCLINNGTQIVMCHGYGATRAIGVTLDSVMSQILEFMLANPYEVLTIEFNQNDGDAGVMSKFIVAKILQYFTLPTGQLMMWPRKSLSDPWPKLRDMILSNQRIMIFMGDTYWSIPDPKPEWANHKDTWKLDGFRYTSEDSQPAELNQSYYNWCTKGPPTDGSYVLWQQMDINLGILKDDILRSLKEGKIPQLCIGPLAVQTNSALLDALADYCYSKWPYWYRVRVNHYWEGNLFPVVNRYNDMNVARVKAGDSITPF